MNDDPKALTNERGKQHGDWKQQAKTGVQLDVVAQRSRNYATLEPFQKKAVDMIFVKLSRILTGDASHADHWDDIAGYAYLGKGGHEEAVEQSAAPNRKDGD